MNPVHSKLDVLERVFKLMNLAKTNHRGLLNI